MVSKLTHVCGQIRQYAEGKSYEQRDPYECIATVQYLSETEVYISGTIGKLNLKEMAALLMQNGVTIIHYERRGKMIKMDLTKHAHKVDTHVND